MRSAAVIREMFVRFQLARAAHSDRPALPAVVREIFGRFQNLNLLMLRESLRYREAVHGDWGTFGPICPVAHGLPGRFDIRYAQRLSQSTGLWDSCRFAAWVLGADHQAVERFLDWWDHAESDAEERLLVWLDEIWHERLEDSDAVQQVLSKPTPVP